MRALALLLALPALGGCAIAQYLPTLKYCDQIKYERVGREITITAHCFEAVEPAFPLPLPKP